MKKPTEVEVITYQVGFGDCFLLKVHYDSGRPHTMLIDFGSTRKEHFTLSQIAAEIKKDCPDGLDVVVATHRHKDHVHGFTRTKAGGGAGKVIRDLEPSVVIQPWTEDPKAQPDATRPTRKYGSQGPAFAARLANMQALAGSIHAFSGKLRFRGEASLRKSLRVLGDNNLGNAAAMENLRTMGKRHYYAYHGMKLGLARELPGVKVRVLGPPTLEQTTDIEKQRSRDEDEFWHLQAAAGQAQTKAAEPLFPGYKTLKDPVWARWARRKFRKTRAEEMLSIVRSLDHQMNNTSVILLLQVGGKRLLFPGDAQLENWNYALTRRGVEKLLKDVDVYKVGHHGSLNATPKSMFKLFQKKHSLVGEGHAMHSLLSTKHGVHGSESSHTEVPRSSLVKELGRETQLQSTTDFPAGMKSRTIRFPV